MRLILNGDDLGYSPAVNQAIFDLHASGRMNSTSLVVNLPHSQAAMEGARERPRLATGIHLNLTKGRPCLAPERVPTLVGVDGAFFGTPTFFARALAGRISQQEVEWELRTQIEKALGAGIRVAHLDSHSHWHIVPSLDRLLRRLVTQYGISRVRTANPRRALVPNSVWLATVPRKAASRRGPAQTDYLLSLHQWLGDEGRVSPTLASRRVRRLLGRPGVVVELVAHPGRAEDPDFPSDTLSAPRRQREFDFLQSSTFADWLAVIGAEALE